MSGARDSARSSSSTWTQEPGAAFYPDDPIWRDGDMRDIPPVAEFDLSKSYEFLHETFGEYRAVSRPGAQREHARRGARLELVHQPARPARHDDRDVVRGPNQVDGPAPGMWHVTGRPDAGITPKFTIKDARGDTYLIKLDPAKFPELPSSVELISTKIFHAIGYHVPEDFIVIFDLVAARRRAWRKMQTDVRRQAAD